MGQFIKKKKDWKQSMEVFLSSKDKEKICIALYNHKYQTFIKMINYNSSDTRVIRITGA